MDETHPQYEQIQSERRKRVTESALRTASALEYLLEDLGYDPEQHTVYRVIELLTNDLNP